MVWIQNQLVGSAIGQKITLECQSEAYPKSINYWMKNETIITLGNCCHVKTGQDLIVGDYKVARSCKNNQDVN